MLPRIAVTVEQFWHPVPGGTARATLETLEALNHVGRFQLQGVAAWHRRRNSATEFGGVNGWPIPIAHYRLPRPALYDGWHRLARPSIDRMLGSVDLIWASAMVIPPKTAPIVATVHDVDFLSHPERLSPRGRSFFPKAWEVTLERSDLVIVPSASVANASQAAGLEVERIRVIPHGVTIDRPSPPMVDAVRRQHRLPKTFLLWVGTLEPRKNLPALVNAVERIGGLHLAVVGPEGWEIDGDDVLAPLGDRVHRLGFVDDGDLRALYSAATAFVLPSLAEGFGLPVLEAMAQDTPVITSAGTATEDAAGDAAVLIDPNSVDELTAAIERVLDDAELRDDLVAKGRKRVAMHSWDATARAHAAVFDELIGSGADGGLDG